MAGSAPSTFRKLLKIVLWSAACFVLLAGIAVGLAAYLVPKYYPPDRVKKMVTQELSKKLNRTIKVKDVSFNLFKGFKITKLSMSNRPGWTDKNFLAADSVQATYQLLPILWGRILLGDVLLEKPEILVERRGPTDYNFTDLASVGATPASASSKKSSTEIPKALQVLEIGKVAIHQAKVTYIDHMEKPPFKVELPGMDLTLKHVSLLGGKTDLTLGTPIVFLGTTYRLDAKGQFRFNLPKQTLRDLKLAGDFSGVKFDVSGAAKTVVDDFAPDMKGKAVLDLSKVLPLVPKSGAPLPKDLKLSGNLTVPFAVGGSLKKGLSFDGNIDLTDSELVSGNAFRKAKGVKCALSFKTLIGEDYLKVPSYQADLASWSLNGSLALTGLEKYPGDPAARPAFELELAAKSLPMKDLTVLSPALKDFTLSGEVGVDLTTAASFKDASSGRLKGSVAFKDLKAVHDKVPNLLEGFTGKIAFTDTSIDLPAMNFKLTGSPTVVSFRMSRFHPGELMDFGKCNALIDCSLKSDDIDLEKLTVAFADPQAAARKEAAAQAAKGKKAPPPDLRPFVSPGLTVNARADIKSFFFRKMKFTPFKAELLVAKRVLSVKGSLGVFSGLSDAGFNLNVNKFPHAYTHSLGMSGVSAQTAVNEAVDSFVKKKPEDYKDKIYGKMDFRNTGSGLLDAAPEKSILGTGPVLVTGVRVRGLAMLGGLFKNLKQSKSEMSMERLEGTLTLTGGKAVLDLKSEGATGRMRTKGAISFEGFYAPELRIENDVRKEALDVDAYFGSLPESLRKKLDINRAADAQGFVPVDFKLTGAVSEVPGAKALDLTRLTKNVTSSYTKGLLNKAAEKSQPVSATVKKAGEALGGKLKGLFGK